MFFFLFCGWGGGGGALDIQLDIKSGRVVQLGAQDPYPGLSNPFLD